MAVQVRRSCHGGSGPPRPSKADRLGARDVEGRWWKRTRYGWRPVADLTHLLEGQAS